MVEFGAVLIDLQTSNLEAEFQCYVQPTDFPYLTQGCVNALGIYQDDVDDALPLKNVLHRFYNWIDGIRYDYDLYLPKREYTYEENAFFCTWSNADLGTYLRKECSNNKDIPYANYLKWWINGQEIYRVRIRQIYLYLILFVKLNSTYVANRLINWLIRFPMIF